MTGNQPKQQHIVPRAYLEGFLDPDIVKAGERKVWLYISGRQPFTQRPERLAKRNYYYCYQREGKRQFNIEEGLQQMEDLALPILNKLRSREFNLSDDERITFAGYVALCHTRVPTFERTVNRIASLVNAKLLEATAADDRAINAVCRSHKQQTGENLDPADFKRKLIGGTVIVTQEERGWSLKQSLELGILLQAVIFEMQWIFLLADKSDPGFVTSDNPVSLFDPVGGILGGIGFASSPYAHFTFPICRDICLLAQHKTTPSNIEISERQVRTINRGTITRFDSQVYAPFRSEKIQRIVEHVATEKAKIPGKRVLFRKGTAIEE